jgi:hypothetical protein
MTDQLSILDALKDDAELSWEEFNAKNPFVLGQLIRMVAQAKDRGERQVSMITLFGEIRKTVPRDGKPAALNNNWTAVVSRIIQQERPDLADMIKTRRRHT